MVTRAFNLGQIIGDNNKIAQDKLSENIVLGPEQYTTPDDLPLSGNQPGDQAFISSTNRLYIWSGSGWYSVALINTSPAFDSGGSPEATYELDSIGGTAITITLLATDPEDVPIQYSAIPSDSANDLATITQTDNTFVVAAKSLDSILANGYDSFGGTFNVTFRASDGVNLATALSEFTLTFINSDDIIFNGSTNSFGISFGGITQTSGSVTSEPLQTDGKYYYEIELTAGPSPATSNLGMIGIQAIDQGSAGWNTANTISVYLSTGTLYPGNLSTSFGTINVGGILQFAYDDINRQAWINYNNGSWSPGDPASVPGYPIGGTSGFVATLGSGSGGGTGFFSGDIKVLSNGLNYTPPTGFVGH